jgi:O-antigen ligase
MPSLTSPEARRFPAGLLPAGGLVILGAAVGLAVYAVGTADMRWLFALTAAFVAVAFVAVLPNRLRLLWLAFVFSFQLLDPNLRLLYGHAGSEGLLFTMPFLLGLCILGGSWAAGLFRERPFRWGGPLAVPIALLFAVMALSSGTSSEHFANLVEILMQAEFYLLYLIGLNLVRNEEDLRRVLRILFITLALQCLIYYAESALRIKYISIVDGLVAGDDIIRPGGTLGPNPFCFANFILPIVLILVADFMCRKGEGAFERWPRGLFIAMASIALALTLTRSAWVSFAIGCIIVASITARRRLLSVPKIVALGLGAVVAAIAAAPLIVQRLERDRFDDSYNERVALMQMAVNVVQANPLLGVGPGAYGSSFKQYLTADLADKWQYVVHNHYLLRAAETGIPGALVFVALLVIAIRLGHKLSDSRVPLIRTFAIGITASILAALHQMIWDSWTQTASVELFWLLLGLLGAAQTIEAEQRVLAGDGGAGAGDGGAGSESMHAARSGRRFP